MPTVVVKNWASNQQSILLCLLALGLGCLKGPAQTNRSKGGARPLKTPPAWRLDQGDDSRILVERLINPSILPRPKARRSRYPGSWRVDEHSNGGSGELSGDDLASSMDSFYLDQEGSEINHL
ncbi:hypothetical protein Acr_22g0004560 [Actinidia rufa]|uniref:Uncharacterized protein n=1 Tax=Actinidia rufa TaxID=165716 RepID=A0A7J0GJY6_9ERIC|nr:hypothetical protein Acr_22g0004560 [Actinidia rufa]